MRVLLLSLLSFAYGEESTCSTCSTKAHALLQVRGDLARGVAPEEESEREPEEDAVPELAALMEDHLSLRREEEEAVAAVVAARDEELTWTSARGACGNCTHCFIDGVCYEKSPEGLNATEPLCLQHGGTWCPTGKTGKGPAKVDVPCISEGDFKADLVTKSKCELKDPADCKGGCKWSRKGYCRCPDGPSCQGLNGTWKVETCGSGLRSCGAACANLTKAKAAGSCDNLTLMGRPMDEMVSKIAMHCCASAPKSVCEPNAELPPVPCSQSSDFNENATFSPRASCGMIRAYWKPMGDAIEKAKAAKTCGNVTLQGKSVERIVSYYASRCCREPRKTVCNPTGQAPSPCKDPSDFKTNGTIKPGFSCADLSSMMGPALKKARAQGSCKGVKLRWGRLSDLVGWAARACCKGPSLC